MGVTPGLDMPLSEAMETQRAIRRLKPDPVDDALLRRLLELALKAPTGATGGKLVQEEPERDGRFDPPRQQGKEDQE